LGRAGRPFRGSERYKSCYVLQYKRCRQLNGENINEAQASRAFWLRFGLNDGKRCAIVRELATQQSHREVASPELLSSISREVRSIALSSPSTVLLLCIIPSTTSAQESSNHVVAVVLQEKGARNQKAGCQRRPNRNRASGRCSCSPCRSCG